MLTIKNVEIRITATSANGAWRQGGTVVQGMSFEELVYVRGQVPGPLAEGDVKGELHRALNYVLEKIDDKRAGWDDADFHSVEVESRWGKLLPVDEAERDDDDLEMEQNRYDG